MLPPQSYIAWKVCLTFLHTLALSSTVLRLWDRYRGRKLWWDDYIAGFALLLDAVYAIMFWLRFQHRDPYLQLPLNHPRRIWIQSLLFFTIVWASRISLSLSLCKIFSPGTTVRKWLLRLTWTFVVIYLVTAILSSATCPAGVGEWRPPSEAGVKGCKSGLGGFYASGLISVSFDFIADILLVACPLLLLWRVQLPKAERRLVLVAFSASVFPSLATVVFAVFWYGGINLGEERHILLASVAHIQVAISLIVCNFLVVATFFWRLYKREHGSINSGTESSGRSIPTRNFIYDGSQVVEVPEQRSSECTFTPISESDTRSRSTHYRAYSISSYLANRPLAFTATFHSLIGRESTPSRPPRPHPTFCTRTIP
ncbi:hypothetical protein FA15DRAFT_735463 [Coprinopsis marcescibilis]|uniref:Rhodopsin domain-containing protein n=1 Tax=Coprinopsis marcescibilis TaxID=230819 RepID=A0A5C3KZ18_COPMA|nr:hypothetical protein FA15DRAFT_735463 [Coprinopsis marcescibilis]